jgi:hypothetical protein
MTQEELDALKVLLKLQKETTKGLWLEKQLLRNFILDSGWLKEQDLDFAIERGKKDAKNVQEVEEHFAASDQALAEIGIEDWLADFERKYPSTD